MPVWSFPYIVLLMLVTALSTALKRRLGVPWWWGALDTLSVAVLLWLFVGYFRPEVIGALSAMTPVLYVAMLLWLGLSTQRELRLVEQMPAEAGGSTAQWISLFVGVLLLTPALGCGAIAAMRAWQGGG